MKKYFKIFFSFLKTGLIMDLEFRFNFFLRICVDIIWYLGQIIAFEVLFLHTQHLAGWSLAQVRVFLGMLYIVDALYMCLFSENLDQITKKVKRGDLDLLLTKPVNSQFMVSLQKISVAMGSSLFIGISYLVWALSKLPNLNLFNLLWIILYIPCGLICYYTFRFIFATFAVIFTSSDSLQFVWHQIYRLGMRPDTIYPSWLRLIILTVFPVAMIASIPSQMILGIADYRLALFSLFWSLCMLWLSHKFWNFALTKYSSASS